MHFLRRFFEKGYRSEYKDIFTVLEAAVSNNCLSIHDHCIYNLFTFTGGSYHLENTVTMLDRVNLNIQMHLLQSVYRQILRSMDFVLSA